MPFAVHISFVGLCLSTTNQDSTTNEWTLQVAMPNCPTHATAIVYDGRYQSNGPAFNAISLDACTLDWSGVQPPAGGFHPQLPPELLNLLPILGDGSLLPFACGTSKKHNVKCLVTLRNGYAAGIGLPKTWTVLGEGKRLTHCLEWRIQDVPGTALDLSDLCSTLPAGSNTVLTPVDTPDGLEVRFSIVCLPPKFISHAPVPDPFPSAGDDAPHFAMFAGLFNPWYPNAVPKSTGPGVPKTKAKRQPRGRLIGLTVSAQDCISSGYGGGG